MTVDQRDLITQLGTQVGMVMEDASVIAITLGSVSDAELSSKLDALRNVADQITALVIAAQTLAGL